MSEEAILKNTIKELNCYLEVILRKYSILKSQREMDLLHFDKKHLDSKSVVESLRADLYSLQIETEQLRRDQGKLLKKYEDYEDLARSSTEKQLLLEDQLSQKCAEYNAMANRLKDLEEELSIVKIQVWKR